MKKILSVLSVMVCVLYGSAQHADAATLATSTTASVKVTSLNKGGKFKQGDAIGVSFKAEGLATFGPGPNYFPNVYIGLHNVDTASSTEFMAYRSTTPTINATTPLYIPRAMPAGKYTVYLRMESMQDNRDIRTYIQDFSDKPFTIAAVPYVEPTITVTSPDADKVIDLTNTKKDNFIVTWNTTGFNKEQARVSIVLADGYECLIGTAPVKKGEFKAKVGENYRCDTTHTLTSGTYKIKVSSSIADGMQVIAVSDTTNTGVTFGDSQSTGNTATAARITISKPVEGTVVKAGLKNALRVNGTTENIGNSERVDVYLVYPDGTEEFLKQVYVYKCEKENLCGGFRSNKGLLVTVPASAIPGTGYKIKAAVTVAGGQIVDYSDSFTVTSSGTAITSVATSTATTSASLEVELLMNNASVKAGELNGLKIKGTARNIPANALVRIFIVSPSSGSTLLLKDIVCKSAADCGGFLSAAGTAVTIPSYAPAGPGYKLLINAMVNERAVASDTTDTFVVAAAGAGANASNATTVNNATTTNTTTNTPTVTPQTTNSTMSDLSTITRSTITVTKPVEGTSVKAGSSNALNIRGTVENVNNRARVRTYLIAPDGSETFLKEVYVYICTTATDCGGFRSSKGLFATVPATTPAGSGYKVRADVVIDGKVVSDMSDSFTVTSTVQQTTSTTTTSQMRVFNATASVLQSLRSILGE